MIEKLKRTSLHNRLTLTISLLFIVAYFSSLFITQKIAFHFVDQQYRDRIFTISRNLAMVCYQPILNHNNVEILKTARAFLQERDVEYITILDRSGNILVSKGMNAAYSDSLLNSIKQQITVLSNNSPSIIETDSSRRVVVYPIKSENSNQPWGYVISGFNDQKISEMINKAQYSALLISTVVLLIGLIFLQRFTRGITKPVRELMIGTDQVSSGNFDYQIRVKDEGEFGQLARKFNEMTLKLNYYNKQKTLLNKKLHEYNATLEERIRERTLQLKKIQQEVLLIFHQIPVGLLVVDLDGTIMWFNQELLNITELEDEQSITGKLYSEIGRFNDINLNDVLTDFNSTQEKMVTQHELTSDKIVEIASQPLIREDRQHDGTIFIIKDITHEITLEKKMVQKQRLESVGTIAGGIAHDFNNILAIILPNAQLLKLKLQDNPEQVKCLETIEKATEQASHLTRQILSFSRGSNQENLEIINVEEVITDFTNMIRRVLDRKIEIKQDIEPGLQNIKADRGQIEQILMNLSVNARDAMPQGGQLIFRGRNIELGHFEKPMLDPNLVPGEYVQVEIEDTGDGIPQKYMDKIFDPFFSSKKSGKGTGLGLSVVYGIIRGHKGIIDAESTVGEGTVFRMYFPACKEKIKKPRIVENPLEPGTGTVLIVDDEKMIKETLTSMLENLNYNVISADNGKSAIETYRQHQQKIDVILMDIQMPLMDGVEAASQIINLDPHARIIFTSGYADPSRFEELKKMGYQYFLKKPYRIAILADIIKQALTDEVKAV